MRDKKRDSDCQAVVFGSDCDAGQKAGDGGIPRGRSRCEPVRGPKRRQHPKSQRHIGGEEMRVSNKSGACGKSKRDDNGRKSSVRATTKTISESNCAEIKRNSH